MYEYNILTQGENLRKIRKEFGIKQCELTSNKFTPNLICMIEKNKSELVPETAKVITDNMNKILKKKGINFSVKPEDLVNCRENQIKSIINDISKKLSCNKSDTSDLINAAYKVLTENSDIDLIIPLYLKVGNVLIKNKDYKNAYIFYIKAYDEIFITQNYKDIVKITNTLIIICHKLDRLQEATRFIDNTLELEISNIDRYKLLFNKSKLLKNQCKYRKALKILNQIDKSLFDKEVNFRIETLKANCYEGSKKYSQALDIHRKIYKNHLYTDKTDKIIVLCNIIAMYQHIDNIDNMFFINKYLDLINEEFKDYSIDVSAEYGAEIYFTVSQCNIAVGNIDTGISLIKLTLDYCKANNLYDLEYNCIKFLFNIYKNNIALTKEKIENEVNKLFKDFNNLLSKHQILKYNELIFEFIKFYPDNKKNEIIDLLVNSTSNKCK